jgi:hypothetical protein
LRAGSFGGGLASGRCASSMLLDDILEQSNKSNDLFQGATVFVPLTQQTDFRALSHQQPLMGTPSKAGFGTL